MLDYENYLKIIISIDNRTIKNVVRYSCKNIVKQINNLTGRFQNKSWKQIFINLP